jgi:hypothetical protein
MTRDMASRLNFTREPLELARQMTKQGIPGSNSWKEWRGSKYALTVETHIVRSIFVERTIWSSAKVQALLSLPLSEANVEELLKCAQTSLIGAQVLRQEIGWQLLRRVCLATATIEAFAVKRQRSRKKMTRHFCCLRLKIGRLHTHTAWRDFVASGLYCSEYVFWKGFTACRIQTWLSGWMRLKDSQSFFEKNGPLFSQTEIMA